MCEVIKTKIITPTKVRAGYYTVKTPASILNAVLPPSLRTKSKIKQCSPQNSHR